MKKKKKRKKGLVKYRTQCLQVGYVKCLFLSFYDRGRSPIITIGPHYPLTIVLVIFGTLFYFFFQVLLETFAKAANPNHLNFCYFLQTINILTAFVCFLKNQGIPQAFILRMLKNQLLEESQ